MSNQLALLPEVEHQTPAGAYANPFAGATVTENGQERSYEENLVWWTQLTVAWIWHNDRVTSPRSQSRYWDVWLDCFGGYGRFEYLPFETDTERALRISHIIDRASVKPWEYDARAATQYKIMLENRRHTTGRSERRGKSGTVLQKNTRCEKPLSPKSIGNALAILSSYYRKATRYPIYKDSKEAMLFDRMNPFDSVERPKFEILFEREGMTLDEVHRVLEVIPRDTVRGALHLALLKAYALTGRRNSEVRTAKWGDFKATEDGKVWHTWRGKHHVEGKTDEIAPDVLEAIVDYLEMSGRIETIQPDDYVFVAPSDRARSLHGNEGWQPGVEPLSIREVNRIFQTYLKRAKIKGGYVIHSLRHTLAEQMLEEGARIDEVQRQLGHANIATTLIYTQRKRQELSGAVNRVADKIGSHRIRASKTLTPHP